MTKRYFTGDPCRNGHIAERLISNRACVICLTERKLTWAKDNSDKLAEKARNRRSNNPEKIRNYERNRYQVDPRIKMLSAAKQRAIKKNLEFNLTIDDIKIPNTCPLLEIPLVVSSGKITDNSPSLDRIDNNRGYTKDNIIIISHMANRCKSDLNSDKLLKLAQNLKILEDKYKW